MNICENPLILGPILWLSEFLNEIFGFLKVGPDLQLTNGDSVVVSVVQGGSATDQLERDMSSTGGVSILRGSRGVGAGVCCQA